MLLYAKLLGSIQFELDGDIVSGLNGRTLELLVFLASRGEAKTWSELEVLGFSHDDLAVAELEPVREFLIAQND